MSAPLSRRTASLLARTAPRPPARALVGFDGFVDTILHVVKTRLSATKYERLSSMAEWSQRIAAASGVSANFEFVPQVVKLGGNGVIMADALARLGCAVSCIGTLGHPALHPVFADFAKRARVISLAEPAGTDAIEFADGKLMCSKLENLGAVKWSNLLRHFPEEELRKMCAACELIAMVNWTMLSGLTDIFRKMLTRILPALGGPRRWIFFDLADPAKRSREDLRTVLRLIARHEKFARVIFGMNLGEARQVAAVLNLGGIEETRTAVTRAAVRIRGALGIDTVVIHPTRFAAAADRDSAAAVTGPLTLKPKITTGAGDHFNAGFCLARLRGFALSESLQVGVAASGFFVRTGKSPGEAALVRFLRSL